MKTICLEISFDGTRYAGWQRQKAQKTIQGEIENALSTITNCDVKTIGAGRTDAGVHARRYMASFVLESSHLPMEAFVVGGNSLLPPDIRILSAQEKALPFHALRSARSKKYRYFFTHTKTPNVFLNHYVWQLVYPYDLPLVKEASSALVGEHDFRCFATHGVTTSTTVRRIYSIEFGKMFDQIDYIEIHANGFLRHMVRAIVGTLLEVGLGKRDKNTLLEMIQSQKRENAGLTAPANGLFLWDIEYES